MYDILKDTMDYLQVNSADLIDDNTSKAYSYYKNVINENKEN